MANEFSEALVGPIAEVLEGMGMLFETAKGVKIRMINEEGWSAESAEVIALGFYQVACAAMVQGVTKS